MSDRPRPNLALRRANRALKAVGFWALVAFVVLFSVFPFYYAILTSLESGSALFEVNYLPSTLDLSNYVSVLTKGPFPLNFLNSVLVPAEEVEPRLPLSPWWWWRSRCFWPSPRPSR